jgi:hypothetical protein
MCERDFGEFLISKGAATDVVVAIAERAQRQIRWSGHPSIPPLGEVLLYMGVFDRIALDRYVADYRARAPAGGLDIDDGN